MPYLLVLLVIVSACAAGGELQVDPGETESSADPPGPSAQPETSQPAATTTTVATTTTTLPPTTTTLFSPEITFCESLEIFFEVWVNDLIGPADLTMAYETLGELAPEELVGHFETLAEGNAILVATRDRDQLPDADAYDASGAAVAAYATDECGLTLDGT